MRVFEQLQLKLELERIFLRDVMQLFNTMKAEFRLGVATGKRTRAKVYKPQWVTAINKHYKRTQKAFTGIVKDNTKQDEQDDDLKDEILAALLLWAEKQSPLQADIITQTSQDNMDQAIEQARQAFSDEGNTDYTNRELAAVAAAILGRKFKIRSGTITTYETQSAAESTKLIDAYAISGLPPIAVVTGAAVASTGNYKQWVTMRDERVRPAHRAADGQIVQIEKAYTVGGERLMYPGDTSLGASIGNVINCRCVSYFFKKV